MKVKVRDSKSLKALIEQVKPLLQDFLGRRRGRETKELAGKVAILREALRNYDGPDKDEILATPIHGNNPGGYITYATGIGATSLEDAVARFDDLVLEGRLDIKEEDLPEGVSIMIEENKSTSSPAASLAEHAKASKPTRAHRHGGSETASPASAPAHYSPATSDAGDGTTTPAVAATTISETKPRNKITTMAAAPTAPRREAKDTKRSDLNRETVDTAKAGTIILDEVRPTTSLALAEHAKASKPTRAHGHGGSETASPASAPAHYSPASLPETADTVERTAAQVAAAAVSEAKPRNKIATMAAAPTALRRKAKDTKRSDLNRETVDTDEAAEEFVESIKHQDEVTKKLIHFAYTPDSLHSESDITELKFAIDDFKLLDVTSEYYDEVLEDLVVQSLSRGNSQFAEILEDKGVIEADEESIQPVIAEAFLLAIGRGDYKNARKLADSCPNPILSAEMFALEKQILSYGGMLDDTEERLIENFKDKFEQLTDFNNLTKAEQIAIVNNAAKVAINNGNINLLSNILDKTPESLQGRIFESFEEEKKFLTLAHMMHLAGYEDNIHMMKKLAKFLPEELQEEARPLIAYGGMGDPMISRIDALCAKIRKYGGSPEKDTASVAEPEALGGGAVEPAAATAEPETIRTSEAEATATPDKGPDLVAKAREDLYRAAQKGGTINRETFRILKAEPEILEEAFYIAAENGKTTVLARVLEAMKPEELKRSELAIKGFVRAFNSGNLESKTYLEGLTSSGLIRGRMESAANILKKNRTKSIILKKVITDFQAKCKPFLKAGKIGGKARATIRRASTEAASAPPASRKITTRRSR